MIFTTYWFLLFAGFVIGVFWLLPRPQWRSVWLAMACIVFHAHFAGPAGVLPIVVLMVVTYFAGRSRNPKWCVVGITVCVCALCFYKYSLFLIDSAIRPLSSELAEFFARNTQAIMPAAPPLAVSFFVFEFV